MKYYVYLIGLATLIHFACVKKGSQKNSAFAENTSGSQTIDIGTSNNATFIKTDSLAHIIKESVPVIRVKTIKDDFNFASEWHYNEFVYKTESGELHCDGICDPSIDTMYDVSGNIKKHLRNKYYSIVDTSHIYKTIECDAWCYEYGGIDEIVAERYNNGTVSCYTMCNLSTHCSLVFELEPHIDSCKPVIELHSIADREKTVYACLDGAITIDTSSWSRDTLKAIFDFKFVNTDGPEPMFWKGKICTPIL
jgi:hypothetical protein